MKKLFACALICLSSLAFAGDAAKLTHIGFSADGKNYAFMESGIHDGLGNAYARIQIFRKINSRRPQLKEFNRKKRWKFQVLI